jgi:hypothetical protein
MSFFFPVQNLWPLADCKLFQALSPRARPLFSYFPSENSSREGFSSQRLCILPPV